MLRVPQHLVTQVIMGLQVQLVELERKVPQVPQELKVSLVQRRFVSRFMLKFMKTVTPLVILEFPAYIIQIVA